MVLLYMHLLSACEVVVVTSNDKCFFCFHFQVMGQVFVNSMKFGGSKTETAEVIKTVDSILALAAKQKVTERESKHVTALKLVTEGCV